MGGGRFDDDSDDDSEYVNQPYTDNQFGNYQAAKVPMNTMANYSYLNNAYANSYNKNISSYQAAPSNTYQNYARMPNYQPGRR